MHPIDRPQDDRPTTVDPVALLLADKRSPATRRAYRADLVDFFSGEPTPDEVRTFLALPAPALALRLATYKSALLERGVSEATVNRRLSAIRSLLKFAHRVGFAATDGRGLVDGERVRPYRNTRGVNVPTVQRLLAAPGTETLRGLRDTALLRLMCENALRRAEVCHLDVKDFEREERRLTILGKGRGTQQEAITLSEATARAISAYLEAAGHGEGALFRSLHRVPRWSGERLTPDGLHFLVGSYGRSIGVEELTPHKIRHSSITAALDATNGDVRRVQQLLPTSGPADVTQYDDNRRDLQGQVTNLLAELFDRPSGCG